MIKCIAADLDRTLLRGDKTISPFTQEVLSRCRAQGIKLVFATGRPFRSVQQYLLHLSPDALIVHNGSVAYIPGKPEPLFHYGIPPEATQKIIAALLAIIPECKIAAELNDVLYCNFNPNIYWDYTDYQAFTSSEFTQLPDIPAEKLIIGATREDLIAPLLPEDCYVQLCEGRICLILPRAATKWNALAHLACHWGIPASEIAAFGDDLNDMEMLQNCGTGVAVANAPEEVKAAANEVCASNEEDGVARWILSAVPQLK